MKLRTIGKSDSKLELDNDIVVNMNKNKNKEIVAKHGNSIWVPFHRLIICLLVLSYCLSMFGSLRPVYLRPATIKLLWESSTITANFSLKSGNGIIKTNKKFNFAPSLSCCF